MKTAVLALIVSLAIVASAAAEPPSPPSPRPTIGFRAFAAVDAETMAAADSFKAVFGSTEMIAGGGGGEIDIWRHLFLRIAATRARRTGSRVFVDGGNVFPLNIPLTATMTPVEAGGGWRFASASRLTPYAGGALISLGYSEVSDFAQAGENVNDRYTGVGVFGGVDISIWKGLFVGAEGQYRRITVPDVQASVMHEFGERDLGGASARILIGFSTK